MLEDTSVPCPKCDTELHVKMFTGGRRPVYVIAEDCPNCKTKANSIEKGLNSTGKKWGIKTEKSYIKTDPRG